MRLIKIKLPLNTMKIITAGLFLLVAASLPAQTILTPSEFNKRLTYFYEQPDTGTLKTIIYTLKTDQALRESFPPSAVLGFCTGILLTRNNYSRVLSRELKKYSDEFPIFDFILNLGDTQDTIKNWKQHGPEENDMMWSAYFGTGDVKYLDRLLSETKFMHREDSLNLLFAATSSVWSLCSNARQHPAIDRYLRRRLNEADEQTKQVLQEILSKEPQYFKEKMVAQIQDMKKRGMFPDASKPEPYQPKLVRKPKGGLIGFTGPSKSFSIEVESKELSPTDTPGFFDVDGRFLQTGSVEIPSNIDLKNVTPELERGILNGYVIYEMNYFEKELKQKITDPSINFETINKKLFIIWSFASDTPAQAGLSTAKRHIYYSTVCYDRVLTLSSVITANENAKAPENMLRSIAKTLKLYNSVIQFE